MPRYRKTHTCSLDDRNTLRDLAISLEGEQTHLFLTSECEDVDAFGQWLDSIPVGSLPKLSMPVSLSLLKQSGFLNLITTLNNKSPDVLVLDVGDAWDAHAEDIEHVLITDIIPLVDFP
jgi:hypothetical protein